MKNKLLIIVAAVLCVIIFALVGCADPADENQTTSTSPAIQGEVLVAYFSCTGSTEGIAEIIAETANGTLFEIVPQVPYTSADLDYSQSDCRANREQNDENARPAIANEVENIASYDAVFIGYPIWWGDAPRIIQTFLENYDFEGKTVYTFSTSGSSSGSGAFGYLSSEYPDINFTDNLHFTSSQLSSARERVEAWISQ